MRDMRVYVYSQCIVNSAKVNATSNAKTYNVAYSVMVLHILSYILNEPLSTDAQYLQRIHVYKCPFFTDIVAIDQIKVKKMTSGC